MICPMMSFKKQYVNEVNCKEENCAWWNKNCGECAIVTFLAKNSKSVSEAATGQRTIFVKEC